MLILYPPDPSTKFLLEVYDTLKKRDTIKIPPDNISDNENMRCYIQEVEEVETLLFLGHGTSEELQGGFGDDIGSFINSFEAKKVFKRKKLILFSCYSGDFIRSLENEFEVGIGFGNILTSKGELSFSDYNKYNYEDFSCIYLFRSRLTILLLNSLLEANKKGYTFYELYNALMLRINKAICHSSMLKDKSERLAGQLMYDLKKEIVLLGNSSSLVF